MRLKNLFYIGLLVTAGCGMKAHHPDAELAQRMQQEQQQTQELLKNFEGLPPEDQLNAGLDALWELQMKFYPQWATYRGDRRYDGRLNDVSDEALREYQKQYAFIARTYVSVIDPQKLSEDSRDTQAMVAIAVRNMNESTEKCANHLWAVNGLEGPNVRYAMLPVFFPIRNTEDLANLEKRYRATGAQIDAFIANRQKGLDSGYAPTKVNVERALKQLQDAEQVPLEEDPMLKLNMPNKDQQFDTTGVRDAVETVVRPALKRYREFLETKVLPVARTEVGVSNIPKGQSCYQARIESYIGPGFTPEQLHQIGLEELKWAQDGMMQVAKDLGKKPKNAQEFMKAMTKDPENFIDSEEQLLEMNRAVVAAATNALPTMFNTIPKTPVEVRPIEAHRAPSAPAAYYNGAPKDGSRPGIYYCNTYEPKTRPLYNLEALAFHEANPGHHLQIAISQERPDAHEWRQSAGQTAFTEGWALYAEILADEMGLYTSPRTKFGMYNYQAWRAVRLVVDTGMHHMGWSRQKAIDFLMENTALTENEVVNEIDRYIAWPGQALAYMVGRRKIQELRKRAETELGPDFDVKAFHTEVVSRGSVPLELLEKNINAWIASQNAE